VRAIQNIFIQPILNLIGCLGMQIISDLHLHSKYSRATSKDLDIKNLEKWARVKGLNLLGTGDFTHPEWIKEIKSNLEEQDGILKTKTGMNFIMQTEVSLIYTDNNKGRRTVAWTSGDSD